MKERALSMHPNTNAHTHKCLDLKKTWRNSHVKTLLLTQMVIVNLSLNLNWKKHPEVFNVYP